MKELARQRTVPMTYVFNKEAPVRLIVLMPKYLYIYVKYETHIVYGQLRVLSSARCSRL